MSNVPIPHTYNGRCIMTSLWVIALFLIGDCICTSSPLKAKEGSCVNIVIDLGKEMHSGNVVWLKNATWNSDSKDYEGTVVYSLKADKPAENEFENRVSVNNGLMLFQLTISNLRLEDNGTYMARYYSNTNQWGTGQVSLDVEKNPCLVNVSGPKLVRSGETVHLQCSISATCPDKPEWAWPESAQLPSSSYSQDAKTAKLSFPALWSHDGVTFTCSPSQSKDVCVSRSIKLTVEYSPIDTTVDSYYPSIKEGDAVTLTCHSKGNPQPTFRWFKVGRGEPTQERVWTLNRVTAEDAGGYFCQATNKLGNKNSTVVKLDVIYAPKGVSIRSDKALDSIREGERISFTCDVQSSNPTASYSWYKDSSQLGCTDRELSLTDIKLQDTGHYYCRATNSVGYNDSPNVQITVHYGPRDTSIESSCCEGGVKVGKSLTLTCHTEARPKPDRYTWYHALPLTGGWTEVPAPSNGPSDRRALSWEQISVGDAGEYMCQAANEISAKNSTSHRVDVLYGPTGLTLLMAAAVRESSLVTIHCTVESNPPSSLNLTWVPAARLHPGLPPETPDPKAPRWKPPGRSARTNLSSSFNASVRDGGLYTCQAVNAEGQDNTSQRLVVNYGPRKPVVIHNMTSRGQPVEESAVALMCSSESYPPINSYKWYIQDDINTKKFFKDKQNLTIGNGQGGVYYCLVDNDISSSSSDKIEIRFYRSPTLILSVASGGTVFVIFIFAIIIFLVYRKRRKSTQESLQNGSRNGTRETLVMDWLGDPQRSRESLLAVAAPPLEPLANQHGSHSKPCLSITTVYSALKISGRTQQGESPAAPRKDREGAPEVLARDHAMDYASLQFPGKRNRTGLKAEESSECVYSTVSKPNRNKTEEQEADYENVKGAVPRRRTTEEDPDICYTTVSFAAGPGPKGPRRCSDSSDEDDYRTQYSEVRA